MTNSKSLRSMTKRVFRKYRPLIKVSLWVIVGFLATGIVRNFSGLDQMNSASVISDVPGETTEENVLFVENLAEENLKRPLNPQNTSTVAPFDNPKHDISEPDDRPDDQSIGYEEAGIKSELFEPGPVVYEFTDDGMRVVPDKPAGGDFEERHAMYIEKQMKIVDSLLGD